MSENPPVINLRDQRAKKLGAEITELYGYITAGTYELLVKLREFDADELWAGPGLVSCAHWLNWQCGIGMNAAREKVRVARALGELPKISEAFRKAEISYSKVRAMTRVATPANEDYLLMIARNGTAHHVELLVRGYRRAVRLNEPEISEQQLASRSFNYHWDDDGSLVFNGRLPAEVGAMLMKALQASIDRRGKDVYPGGTSTAETPAENEDVIRDSLSQKRADAIAELAETYLANGPAESSTAERYQVMLHVHIEGTQTPETSATTRHCEEQSDEAISMRLSRPPRCLAMTGNFEDGPGVTVETSRRICCDASVTRLVEDQNGELLSIGRKSRVVPPAMRRALKARDRQCRFPGCTHAHFIDGHHIKHWADGGETSLDNLVQLCRFHHRLVHEGGYYCEKDGAGNVVFLDPEGRPIHEYGRLPRLPREQAVCGNVIANLKHMLEDRFIDQQSIRPDWHGESMDKDLAVGMLWDLEHRENYRGNVERQLSPKAATHKKI